MTTTLPSHYYEFREPNSKEELENWFKFRYTTYLGTDLEWTLNHNDAQLDIDSYDQYALPFLIFKYENQTKSIVGSMRCIYDTPTKYAPLIEQLAKQHQLSELLVSEAQSDCFTSMQFGKSIKNAIFDFKQQIATDKQTLVEVGRFMIDKSERNRRLAFLFMEMLYAYFPKSYHFYNHCSTSHTSGYRIAGGELFPNTQPFSLNDLDWNVLYFNRKKAASFIVERTDTLSAAFAQYGHIIYDADKPQSFFTKNQDNQLVQIV
jgi:hypothetical protein